MTYYNCPNCGKEMKNIVVTLFAQFDSDYSDNDYISIGEERKKCKIKHYFRNGGHDEHWELPNDLKPTEKQAKTVLFIKNRQIGLGEFPVTKKQRWQFISKYFEQAKKTEPIQYLDDVEDSYIYEEEF